MGEKSFRLEIFLISLAAVLLEIAFTRIFSYKLYYYFTYLILGLALLGLGSGGIAVSLSERLRRSRPERVVALCALAAGVATPLSYSVVAGVQVNTQELLDGLLQLFALATICLALFIPFLLVGVALATILGARTSDVGRLYFADLLGAGLACALAVPLFASLGPPGAVLAGGALLAAAGARLSMGTSRAGVAVGSVIAALSIAGALLPNRVPDPVPDRMKAMSPQVLGNAEVLFSSWSSLFRVDVIDAFGAERMIQVVHDGMLGSIIVNAREGVDAAPVIDGGIRAAVLDAFPREGRILIIGAAGGHEILTALRHGAGEIVAVELNPVTVSLLRDRFAEYSGQIAFHPKVELVTAEGRSFVGRQSTGFDLVWFVAPDSYSALNAASSGAFVLSESYLYTVEMIQESLEHLRPGGWICVQFGEIDFANRPNRTTRYLVTAREALRRFGVEDFASHVVVSTAPAIFTATTVLLKAEPFEPDEIGRLRETTARIEGARIIHAPGDQLVDGAHPAQRAIHLPDDELAAWLGDYPYAVSAVTDDSPFFWHFVRFRDLVQTGAAGGMIPNPEEGTGERTLLTLLALATLFGAAFLLLPLTLVRETWRQIPYKANAFLYFAALGLGFMFFEVCLIQKLTLFLGYPTYSLTVTLFALLVFSGVGSLLSGSWQGPRRRVLARLLAAVLVLMVFYQFGLELLVERLVGLPLAGRVAIAVLILAPLGLCLGAFMPTGLRRLSELTPHAREYVAWGWAVNGFFSVASSVLATVLSMAFGFKVVLLFAGLVYTVGVLAFARIPESVPRER